MVCSKQNFTARDLLVSVTTLSFVGVRADEDSLFHIPRSRRIERGTKTSGLRWPSRLSSTPVESPVMPAKSGDSRGDRIAAFREGFIAPWEGFHFMNRSPRLWQFGALPVFLNLLITAFVLVMLILAGVWYARELHPRFAGSWTQRGLEVLVILVVFAVVAGLAFVTWLLLQNILCGYFYGKLARQVEFQLGMRPEDLQDVSLRREIVDGLRDVAMLLVVNGGLLLLHIVPVIGSIVAIGGSLYFDCRVLGQDYFEYPLGLRGRKPREIREFCRANRFQTLGLGAAVLLMALVPVISAVFLTTAATGAVLLHRRLAKPELTGEVIVTSELAAQPPPLP